MPFLTAWLWLLLAIPPLLLLQRRISRHTQAVLLLLTRHEQAAMLLNQLIFLPGVVLHEFSHWLMALCVGVRTVGVSVWPVRQSDGSLRLGYVQTERVDFVREALIGSAPLLTGSAAVVSIGYSRLALDSLGAAFANGDLLLSVRILQTDIHSADLLIWLYVLFALSNTMLPSAADRRAWPAAGLLLLGLGLAMYFLGVGPILEQTFGELVTAGVRVAAAAFTITVGLDLLMLPMIYGVEWLLWQVVGERVLKS